MATNQRADPAVVVAKAAVLKPMNAPRTSYELEKTWKQVARDTEVGCSRIFDTKSHLDRECLIPKHILTENV